MKACLEARGRISARSRAAALGHAYHTLNEKTETILSVLAEEFGQTETVLTQLWPGVESPDSATLSSVEAELRRALEAPRLKLLTQFNALPEGVKFLVDFELS